MKLYLYGHEYKYAVEQMLLTMYPEERPEYPTFEPQGDCVVSRLKSGGKYTTATCRVTVGGKTGYGRASVRNDRIINDIVRDSVCQRIVKSAFYRACLAAGHVKPAWGALTGVRPGKLMCARLSSGMTESEALRTFIDEYDVSPERAALCLDTSRHTVRAVESLDARDVCLYVGIPFCPTRCAYCSFVSQSVEKSMKLISPFLEALYLEIEAAAAEVNKLGLRVISVYMGGGTPTTLTAPQLDALCAKLEDCFDLTALREYTVEAGRPDTISEDKLRVLRAHGVDRVSVNPQTMEDEVLNAIGRRHSAEDIVAALGKVRAVGGFAVNMDLIAGLTNDSVQGFEQTIDKVLTLAPENITVHTLSLKRGSRITVEGAQLPTPEETGRMIDIANNRLRAAGYEPYYLYRQKFMSGGFENTGWTKPGHVNLYNICIMEELCSIIAMGGGGSTKLIKPGDGKNIRIMAPKYPQEYISGIEKICADKGKISEFYTE